MSGRIALEPWQRDIVDADPRPFLRGLLHSDGCRTDNRDGVALLDAFVPRKS